MVGDRRHAAGTCGRPPMKDLQTAREWSGTPAASSLDRGAADEYARDPGSAALSRVVAERAGNP